VETSAVLNALRPLVVTDEMQTRFAALESRLSRGSSVLDYAVEIHCEHGVSGYAPNTVAVALFAWLRHRGDFARTLTSVIECGGDTDTVAAIAGGICGAEVGEDGIPQPWIDGICDWPRSVKYIRTVAAALNALPNQLPVPRLSCLGVLLRNAVFLIIVLSHGLRRLIP
jgi:ADP-ribosyl-[dinitrogen reductase] hydrolase